jgi:hypothetical protein
MRAKMEITSNEIQEALEMYFSTRGFKGVRPVNLTATPNIDDRYGQTLGHTIKATIEFEVDAVPFS